MADEPIKPRRPSREEAGCAQMAVFCCTQDVSRDTGGAHEVQVSPIDDRAQQEEKRKKEAEEATAIAKAEEERRQRDDEARKEQEALDKEKADKAAEAARQAEEEAKIADQKKAEEAKQKEMEMQIIEAKPYKDFEVAVTPADGAGLGLVVQTVFPAGAKSVMVCDASGSAVAGDVRAGDTIVGINGVEGDATKLLAKLESKPKSYNLNIRRVTRDFEVTIVKGGGLGLTVDMDREYMMIKKQPQEGDVENYNRECDAGLELVIGDSILGANGNVGGPAEILAVMKDAPSGSKLSLVVRRGTGRLPPKTPAAPVVTEAPPAPAPSTDKEDEVKGCCSVQ